MVTRAGLLSSTAAEISPRHVIPGKTLLSLCLLCLLLFQMPFWDIEVVVLLQARRFRLLCMPGFVIQVGRPYGGYRVWSSLTFCFVCLPVVTVWSRCVLLPQARLSTLMRYAHYPQQRSVSNNGGTLHTQHKHVLCEIHGPLFRECEISPCNVFVFRERCGQEESRSRSLHRTVSQ